MDSKPNAMLQVENGLSTKVPLFVTEPIVTFGKSSESDVILDNPFVSRSHFQISFEAGIFHITDLNSKNGTTVNGIDITPSAKHRLENGDLITIGDDLLRLVFRDVGDNTVTAGSTSKAQKRKEEKNEVRIDKGAKEVWIRGQKMDPPLSPKEFTVLSLLHSKSGDVVGKDDIAQYGWSERDDGDVGDHEIEQCIRRIRRRIEENPRKPKLIVTRKGFGYTMPVNPT